MTSYYTRIFVLRTAFYLSGSLDTLDTTLEMKKTTFHYIIITQTSQYSAYKRVFPYSFLDTFKTLTEKLLPHYSDQGIKSFSGQIDVSEEDVQHTNRVWNLLRCQNFGEFHVVPQN